MSTLTWSSTCGLQFYWQAMTIPARNVVDSLAMCYPLAQSDIFKDLVDGMAHVKLSVGVRRSIVKDEGGFPLLRQSLLLVRIGNCNLVLQCDKVIHKIWLLHISNNMPPELDAPVPRVLLR